MTHGYDGDEERPWQEKSVLKELYEEKRLSQPQIAEKLGCDTSTVSKWLKKNDIQTRSISEGRKIRHRRTPANYRTNNKGYELVESIIGTKRRAVMVHRLIAVAEFGIEEVKGKDVHHKNNIPWDNRPENLKPMSPEKHASYHRKVDWLTELKVKEMLGTTKQSVIANNFGISETAVGRIKKESEHTFLGKINS